RGRAHLRLAQPGARVRESGVRVAARRRADVPDLRPGQDGLSRTTTVRASADVTVPSADRRRTTTSCRAPGTRDRSSLPVPPIRLPPSAFTILSARPAAVAVSEAALGS